MVASTASSTLASSMTTSGPLPPSSSMSRLMPAMRVRRSPVAVSPVKWMALVPGLLTSSSPTTGPGPVTTLTAPAGKPASS